MSSSSDHQPSGAPATPRKASTQEIPVVAPRTATPLQQLPPPGAVQAPAAPVAGPQPTGPVDFVPGLPGAGTPPPPPPAATVQPPAAPASEPGPDAPPTVPAPNWPESLEDDPPATPHAAAAKRERAPRSPQARAALLGLGLAVVALGLLEVGLLLDFGSASYWSAVTLWSAFATLAALVAVLAFAAFYPAGNRLRSGAVWRLAAAGLVGLAVFWVLVVLPDVGSDRGFVLTAALGCLGGALWIGPRRTDGSGSTDRPGRTD